MKIFRIARIMLVSIGVMSLVLAVMPKAQAAGSVLWPNVRLSASASSAQANGSATITVTASFYVFECNNGQVYDSTTDCEKYAGGVKKETPYDDRVCPYSDTIAVNLSVVGEGAVLSKTSVCGGTAASDTFTVKSSTVGTKTITPVISWSYSGATRNGSPVSLSFTTPTAAPAKPKTVTPTPAPAPVVEKPAAPTVASITAGDEQIKSSEPVSVAADDPLVLSGKTVPNGKVAVYVFSDPKLFETTADAEGNWSVKVEGLPEGSHHAEVEVMNPANNQKSDRVKLLDFSVVAATQPLASERSAGPVKQTSFNTRRFIAFAILAVIVIGGVGYLVWKHKQRAKKANDGGPSKPISPTTPPSDTPIDESADTGSSEIDPPAEGR